MKSDLNFVFDFFCLFFQKAILERIFDNYLVNKPLIWLLNLPDSLEYIYIVLEHALVIFIIFEMTLKLYLIPLTIVVITEEELTWTFYFIFIEESRDFPPFEQPWADETSKN